MNIRKLLAGGMASAMLSLGLVGAVSAAPLNSNGSFETGTFNPGVFTQLNALNTSIDNWNVTNGSIDYIGTYWEASEGTRSIDMSGGNAGTLTTAFSTVAGQMYTVTFDLAGNPDNAPEVKTLTVNSGSGPTTYTFNTAGKSRTNMGWESQTFYFTATSNSTTLTFTSLNNSVFGPALDNVSVALTTKDECKKNGWTAFTNPIFKNQGDCVSYVQSSPNAVGNRADNL